MAEPLLEVAGLVKHFPLNRSLVNAVRRDERHVVDAHGAAHHTHEIENREIEQRSVQAVRAKRCQDQNTSKEQPARHQHDAGPDTHERKI